MIDGALAGLSELVRNQPLLAPLFAFVGGALTSITPCSLSTIPLVIGYVGNTTEDGKKAFRYSLVFALGMAVTFTAIGVAASLAGRMISQAGTWWYIVLGILMVLMALQTWDVINLIPSTYLVSRNRKRGKGLQPGPQAELQPESLSQTSGADRQSPVHTRQQEIRSPDIRLGRRGNG